MKIFYSNFGNLFLQKISTRPYFLHLRHCISTSSPTTSSQTVPLSSISPAELGTCILHPDANKYTRKSVIFAKVCSIGSSALGLGMLPIINSSLWEAVAERPPVMVFVGVANCFLLLFALTPLLLHFLTKRFVQNVYFNPEKQLFTTVHYNFFLQKRAIRFTADQVQDAGDAPKNKKFFIPLATCLVRSYPMLLILDENCYTNREAFKLLTKNIRPPGDNPFEEEVAAEEEKKRLRKESK